MVLAWSKFLDEDRPGLLEVDRDVELEVLVLEPPEGEAAIRSR